MRYDILIHHVIFNIFTNILSYKIFFILNLKNDTWYTHSGILSLSRLLLLHFIIYYIIVFLLCLQVYTIYLFYKLVVNIDFGYLSIRNFCFCFSFYHLYFYDMHIYIVLIMYSRLVLYKIGQYIYIYIIQMCVNFF